MKRYLWMIPNSSGIKMKRVIITNSFKRMHPKNGLKRLKKIFFEIQLLCWSLQSPRNDMEGHHLPSPQQKREGVLMSIAWRDLFFKKPSPVTNSFGQPKTPPWTHYHRRKMHTKKWIFKTTGIWPSKHLMDKKPQKNLNHHVCQGCLWKATI